VLVPALAAAFAFQQLTKGGLALRYDLLPTSLATPLGWIRLLVSNPTLGTAVGWLTTPLMLWAGWLVVRAARPRSLAAAAGAAVGTAALATGLYLLVQGPFTCEAARFQESYDRNSVHPVGQLDVSSDAWLAAAARPGTPQAAEAEYLARFLPPDPADRDQALWNLRLQATQVNHLHSSFVEFGRQGWQRFAWLAVSLAGTAWVTMYLDRSRGRRWVNLLVYVELVLPTVFAVAIVATAVGLVEVPDEDRPAGVGALVMIAWFGAVAGTAWVGVARRWRWWVRLGLEAGVLVGGLGVLVAAEVAGIA
jgi:hypothetical protein